MLGLLLLSTVCNNPDNPDNPDCPDNPASLMNIYIHSYDNPDNPSGTFVAPMDLIKTQLQVQANNPSTLQSTAAGMSGTRLVNYQRKGVNRSYKAHTGLHMY